MIDESLLSVGSCVKIANNSKMIMIAGYLPYDNQKKIMYDYIGIYLPIGIRKPRQKIEVNKDYICFKNSDIKKIIFIGYSDKKSDFYCKYLLNIKNKIRNMNTELSDEVVKNILKDSLPDIKNIKSEV
ncbi:MAG: DUF4176 domain-containing protein [Bacilli bacterium]|nr:DUF4176 domain-containing protein [Bacilli bacterium]